MLPTMFRFIWASSFREGNLLVITQSETRIGWDGHVCKRIRTIFGRKHLWKVLYNVCSKQNERWVTQAQWEPTEPLVYCPISWLIFACPLLDFMFFIQWLTTGQWFSPGIPVSSTNKTDSHDITDILLKVALNIITLTLILIYIPLAYMIICHSFTIVALYIVYENKPAFPE
jgi:hypothetical protein